ncbi:MAG TPA: hypothetical protein VNR60_10800 [Croceibacterium sp.]|nr:hypothetical protein [Croceibacterium sp.]
MVRRSLVLTDETARHPFRATLPPHVRGIRAEEIEPRAPWRQRILSDVRGFAQIYCASFVAVLTFIY